MDFFTLCAVATPVLLNSHDPDLHRSRHDDGNNFSSGYGLSQNIAASSWVGHVARIRICMSTVCNSEHLHVDIWQHFYLCNIQYSTHIFFMNKHDGKY